MNKASVSRRILASVAGLAIGAVGAIALATPAQATLSKSDASFVDDCDGTTVTVDVGEARGHYEAYIEVDGEKVWETTDAGASETRHISSDAGEIKVEVKHRWSPYNSWSVIVGKTHTWTNPGWPGENCESPQVEVVEDCDGNVQVTIYAGDTRRTWRVDGNDDAAQFLDFAESHTWDADSLDAVIEWEHDGAFKEADQEYVTRTSAEDCPTPTPTPTPTQDPTPTPTEENGEGGGEELPVTGFQAGAAIGGAALLLALGAGLFLVARRRRITFTA